MTSVARTIASTFARNLLCGSLLIGSFAATHAAIGDGYMEMTPATPLAAVVDPVASLLADNDCWTGEAPANMQGVIPGHVVVTVDNVTRVGGERMVGLALGQIFDGEDNGVTVRGFCR